MRIEPYSVDSTIHITKRGVRGMDIVRDPDDRWRYAKSLFILNDTHSDPNWHRETSELSMFERPPQWPEREPLVRILAWTLLSNHMHLLVQEIRKGGTAKLMQRLGGSMSLCYNLKYKEREVSFRARIMLEVVEGDAHLNYLAFYILLKNVLEMYPGGLKAASADFDDAWKWAIRYPFSSLSGITSGKSIRLLMMLTACCRELLAAEIRLRTRRGNCSKYIWSRMAKISKLSCLSRGDTHTAVCKSDFHKAARRN